MYLAIYIKKIEKLSFILIKLHFENRCNSLLLKFSVHKIIYPIARLEFFQNIRQTFFFYLTHDGLPTLTKGVRHFERRIGDVP